MNHMRLIIGSFIVLGLSLYSFKAYAIATCTPYDSISYCKAGEIRNMTDFVTNYPVKAMAWMAHQMNTMTHMGTFAIGGFFDAKEHFEARREGERLRAIANRDYSPSEELCKFGSYVKTVADSEHQASLTRSALNNILLEYYAAQKGTISAQDSALTTSLKIQEFKQTYCNPEDNAGLVEEICKNTDPKRYNRDISSGPTLFGSLSLDLNYQNPLGSDDEADIIALGKNLYWPNILPNTRAGSGSNRYPVYDARQLVAKNTVAHNSFTALASMKSATQGVDGSSGTAFMKALLKDLGFSDTSASGALSEIDQILGKNPSYYAQMEFLTRKIYQDPNFYTNLYDKPVNVDRIIVALEAIQLMHARDRYDSQLRREMLASQLLEDGIVKATLPRLR